jgi:hypothetical protein
LTESEEDQEKKKKMQAVVEDLKEGVVCLRKEREMTEYEVQFLVWVYLDRAYNGFPRSEINFNDFILLSNYNDAFPSKKN